jgi:hypothetical protein
MATSQELLQALTNMQQNAQSNLPVIPNNGNPRGANNMPGMAESEPDGRLPPPNGRPANGGHFYPWMNPSPSVDLIQQLLARTGGPNQPTPVQVPTANTGGGAPMMPSPILTANTGGDGQVLPAGLHNIQTGGVVGPRPVLPMLGGRAGEGGGQDDMRFRTTLPRAMYR